MPVRGAASRAHWRGPQLPDTKRRVWRVCREVRAGARAATTLPAHASAPPLQQQTPRPPPPRPSQDHDKYTKYIGFDAESLERAAWVRLPVLSTMPRSGTDAIALLSDPTLLLQYKAAWDAWFAQTMPELVGEAVGGFGGKNADIAEVLRLGQHSCPKWNMLATELAFFDGVLRAVRPPPAHCGCPPNPRPHVRRDALPRAHPRRAHSGGRDAALLDACHRPLLTLARHLVSRAVHPRRHARRPPRSANPTFSSLLSPNPTCPARADRARAACPSHLVCSAQARCTSSASPSALSRRSRSPSSSA